MINWRMIVGLAFLLGGMAKMYVLVSGNAGSSNLLFAEIGCAIWMLVGVLFILNGMTKKQQ